MSVEENYALMKDAVTDAMTEMKTSPRLMRINEFDAEDESGDPLRVVGICDAGDDLQFVVIGEWDDGEIYPTIMRTPIYKKGTAAT